MKRKELSLFHSNPLDPMKKACKEVRRQVKMAIAAGRTLPFDLRTLIECRIPLDKIRKVYRKNPMREDVRKKMNELYKKRKEDLVEIARRHYRISGITKSTPKDWIISDILVSEFGREALDNPVNLYQSFHSNPTRMVPRCRKCGGAVKWDKIKGWVHRKTGTYQCPKETNPNLYQSFHGSPPQNVRKVNLPVPKKGERLVKIGRLTHVLYKPENPSKLTGKHYQHLFGDTGVRVLPHQPILATDKRGKALFIIPDKARPRFSRLGIIG